MENYEYKAFMLGLLMEKNRHPYEVQQLLKNSEMKYYIKITKGSLYYTFEQLEKKGFIEVVDIIRNEQRPEQTIYGITQSGKQEFEHLLLEQMIKKRICIVLYMKRYFLHNMGRNN